MFSPDNFAHLKIPLEDILIAIENYSKIHYVGEDAYEKIYRGQLLRSGELISIIAKRLKNEWIDGHQQFWLKISLLSSLKHKNLVSLVGFCDENDEKLIICKCPSRGSLSQFLSNPTLLTWVRRLEISVGIAQALSYIHYDEPRDFSVIHRNIDSGSIQLDDDWEPKLGDFIHSMKIKASERHQSFSGDKVRITEGYTDPTYIETKSANHKSDIYSFGIVLFELLCGAKVVSDHPDYKYLAPVAIFHYRDNTLDDIIDPDLRKQMDPRSLKFFVEIAYDCLNEKRSQRPNVDEIVTRLESALKLQMEHQNDGSLTSISTHVSKNRTSSHKDLSHLKLSWEDITSATNTFSYRNCFEVFKFGTFYKGRLLHSKQFIDVIVKLFYLDYVKDVSKLFWTEVSILSSLEHKNLVFLIGFHATEERRIIVYKKEAHESLKEYLSNETLTWMQRLKICVGVANALSYLHYDAGRDFSVIHCNITSSNILIDDKWEPKLTGFEFSLKNTAARRLRLLLTRNIVKNEYLDPKYKKTGGLTHKSDVYSFGVVLLEVMCGMRAIDEDEDKNYLKMLIFIHR